MVHDQILHQYPYHSLLSLHLEESVDQYRQFLNFPNLNFHHHWCVHINHLQMVAPLSVGQFLIFSNDCLFYNTKHLLWYAQIKPTSERWPALQQDKLRLVALHWCENKARLTRKKQLFPITLQHCKTIISLENLVLGSLTWHMFF